MLRGSALTILVVFCTGCSSLGLSLYPTGHFLTEQAEGVLERAPREADIPKELSKGVVPVHFLEPGDVLLIEPEDLDSDVRIPADQHVLADGSIDLGEFGRAVIAGLTLESAEESVERAIVNAGGKPTGINIRLLEAVHRFYVLGEVNSPGSYPLRGHETVLDAIVAAGGLTGDAAPCKLLLARPTEDCSCRITLPVCYREITQLGDSSTNYQLLPGDRVFVATRSCIEELLFCLATKTCDRCCKCQAPCPDPNLIPFRNTYTRIFGDRWQGRSGRLQSEDKLTTDHLGEDEMGPAVFVHPIDADKLRMDLKPRPQLDGQLPGVIEAPQIPDSFDESE